MAATVGAPQFKGSGRATRPPVPAGGIWVDRGWMFTVECPHPFHTVGMNRIGTVASPVAAAGLAAVAAVHLVWATGSSWPYADRTELAEHIAGRPDLPGPRACVMVGATLATAAAVVGAPGRHGRLGQVARLGVTSALLLRGLAGITGNTRLLVNWEPAQPFVELDRRRYGPLCLVLGALSAIGSWRHHKP